ncbi:MAG: hypothetical protein Q9167_002399 [Letrouitia subvulpina]
MPSATFPKLTDDQIDDLLYFARTNSLSDLREAVSSLSKSYNTSPQNILLTTIDPENGNSLLHMSSANGCMDVISYILLPSSASLDVNLQNSAGNTPLHWASLNGHLDAVKALVGAGADPALRNGTGHDAVYEAEVGGKEEVVSWLLKEGKGLEKGVREDHVEEEGLGEDADKERAAEGAERG